MADVNSIPCQFDAKGWKPCKKPSTNGWCSEHENLKCCSCGGKAVQICDFGIGGLLCGAKLCSSCEHGESGGHITKEVADERRRQEKKEEEVRITSRTSPIQRIDEKLGVPKTLFELLKGNWQAEGYEIKKVYFLELEHGLMGFFPAIFSSDYDRIIFTSDLCLLERVWQIIEPRRVHVREEIAYVNTEIGIMYLDTSYPEDRENQEPQKLLIVSEFEDIVKKEQEPFRWAPGLIGKVSFEKECFLQDIVKKASVLDPAFKSAFV